VAPKIDPKSDAMLHQRYDDMYNNSTSFKSRVHNIVTNSRGLLLTLDTGDGEASYNSKTNEVTVFRNGLDGQPKTDTEIRNDLFFELHNAKKAAALSELVGLKGYNKAMLVGDVKKAAGYALAVEWLEWNNVAESTILVDVVNQEAAANGPLLSSPGEFRAAFNAGADSWTKFSNYLKQQVDLRHTDHYDAAAVPGGKWQGNRILEVVTPTQRDAVTISDAEIAGTVRLKSRANPFTWELVNALRLNQ
jgi:hypothetical protein